jgi:predicted kinase
VIHLVFGRVGAGKTTYARRLAVDEDLVFFCLDEWMAALYTMDAPKPLTLDWMLPRVERAEKLIWSVTQQISATGGDVILELGFFTRAQRDRIRAWIDGDPTQVHVVDAPVQVRRERVRVRNRANPAIEVDDATFDWAESYFEPLGRDEVAGAVIVAT